VNGSSGEHGAWVVNKESKDMAATMKFVEFPLSPEAVQIMSREVGFFPVRMSAVREFANLQRERYPWAENVAYTIMSTVDGWCTTSCPVCTRIPWRIIFATLKSMAQSPCA
jgi:ABC-type glycerol-3-phosphate transport system substrate-binding protein